MAKKSKQKVVNRNLQYEDKKKKQQKSDVVKPKAMKPIKDAEADVALMHVEDCIHVMAVHKSRIESSAEQFVTKGVLKDVQDLYLNLVDKVDDKNSIVISLAVVPLKDLPKEMLNDQKGKTSKNNAAVHSEQEHNGQEHHGTQDSEDGEGRKEDDTNGDQGGDATKDLGTAADPFANAV